MPVLRFPSVLAPLGPCGWAMWLRPTAWSNHTCPCGSLITGAGWWCVCGFRHPSVHVALGPPPASVRRAFPRTDGSDCPQLLLSGPCPQVPLVARGPGGAIPAGKPHVCSVAALACEALPLYVTDARRRSRPSWPYKGDVTSVHAGLAGWLFYWFGVRFVVGGLATSVVCRRRCPRRQSKQVSCGGGPP